MAQPLNTLPDGNYSFSGADYQIIMRSGADKGAGRELTTLQTISISTKTSLYPVRVLGERSPRTYVRGRRTIAGTMIFTLMGSDPFIQEAINHPEVILASGGYDTRPLYLEHISEFDLIIQATSEKPYSNSGSNIVLDYTRFLLQGITLAESGTTLSVNDLYTEVMYTYVARWLTPFHRKNEVELFKSITDSKKQEAALSQLDTVDVGDVTNPNNPYSSAYRFD